MPGDITIDEKSLSKKYRTNVHTLIRAWKRGRTDLEIARLTGLNPVTLQQIRNDIELSHRRIRLAKKKENMGLGQATGQRHIFLSPLT
ncbi:hypothetical protein [Desulfocucumis palustris]|uniref:hypothetical protein n=1 Tax=Desulfocucumis palustris TaxID=1898651 RepID=UPI000CEA19BD|nr:hypothetical protein [Desulfocucumis palustris]